MEISKKKFNHFAMISTFHALQSFITSFFLWKIEKNGETKYLFFYLQKSAEFLLLSWFFSSTAIFIFLSSELFAVNIPRCVIAIRFCYLSEYLIFDWVNYEKCIANVMQWVEILMIISWSSAITLNVQQPFRKYLSRLANVKQPEFDCFHEAKDFRHPWSSPAAACYY